MAIIKGFRSTNIWKAFILNSTASTLVIFVAMTIKNRFDTHDEKGNRIDRPETNFKSVALTLSLTFIASFVAYLIMYGVFGCGGGMISDNEVKMGLPADLPYHWDP